VISNIVRSASIVLAAATAAIGVPASAAEIGTARSMVVRHADLDLTSTSDVATLNRRVATAARAVCGTFHAADLTAKQNVLQCRKFALNDARQNVEVAVASARGGQQLAANGITVGNAVP
jgi:UrcA family protein